MLLSFQKIYTYMGYPLKSCALRLRKAPRDLPWGDSTEIVPYLIWRKLLFSFVQCLFYFRHLFHPLSYFVCNSRVKNMSLKFNRFNERGLGLFTISRYLRFLAHLYVLCWHFVLGFGNECNDQNISCTIGNLNLSMGRTTATFRFKTATASLHIPNLWHYNIGN